MEEKASGEEEEDFVLSIMKRFVFLHTLKHELVQGFATLYCVIEYFTDVSESLISYNVNRIIHFEMYQESAALRRYHFNFIMTLADLAVLNLTIL